jgi:alpha-tubulin suppressor-like RCC1 family protein
VCWGRNDLGQLGDGTTTDRSVPVAASGGQSYTRLAVGLTHTCALRADGAALCWGDNRWGQLGDGTTTQRNAPTPVTHPLAP